MRDELHDDPIFFFFIVSTVNFIANYHELLYPEANYMRMNEQNYGFNMRQ